VRSRHIDEELSFLVSNIRTIQSRAVVVPLASATAFARRSVTARHYLLVRITDDDGVHGIGFCYVGNFGGELAAAAVREAVAPRLIGRPAWQVRGLWEELYQELILHGRAGTLMRVQSAVDIALWDLNARRAESPLWRHLGAVEAESVPAYASGGYYLEGKTPEDLGREMAGYVELGFDAVKMKIGRGTPAEDAARAAAVRDAIGPDVRLMMDANNAWRDLPTAIEHVRALEPYNPYWIEEPFLPDDMLNHARLSRAVQPLVVTGEIEQGRWRHRSLLDLEGSVILQTDAAVCGGITEYQRIAALADGYGITMAPHWFHDLHVHLVASTANAVYVEYFPDGKVLNFRDLIDHQLEVAPGGRLTLPTGPGLGFDFDGSAVDAYAIGPWA
jgi:L-alanine-DL-glutamate epimerase-like enolase superfamily enzyme